MAWNVFGFGPVPGTGSGTGIASTTAMTPILGLVDNSNVPASNVQDGIADLFIKEANIESNLSVHLSEPENAHDGSAIFYDGTGTTFMVPGFDASDPGFQKNVKFALDSLDVATSNVTKNLEEHLIEPENAHDGSSIFYDGTGSTFMVPGNSPGDPGFQKNVKFALDSLDAAIAGISVASIGHFRDGEPLTLIHDNITGEDYYLTTHIIMANCVPQVEIRGIAQGPNIVTVMNYPGDSTRRKLSLGVGSSVVVGDPAFAWYRSSN